MTHTSTRSRLRLMALLLVVLLALPVAVQMVTVPVQAVSQAEIDRLKKESQNLASDRKKLQQQLAAAAADKSKALERKRLLEQQMAVIQAEIDNIADQIAKYSQLIAQKEVELTQAQADEAEQYELFCQRVRYMEEEGQTSYWSILFNSSDFSDLLDRFIMVDEIMEYDNRVMDQLIAMREQIQVDKASLEEAKAGQEAAKKEEEAAKADLKARQADVDVTIREINETQSELKKAEDELKAAAAAMDREIARKEKELEAQMAAQGGIVSEKGFTWPLAMKYNVLSSLYGGRKHPVTGRPNNHTGIDVPAPGGTPILAAKSGVVLTATYNSSYGYYVVISHGNGQSTLYAHMKSRPPVKEGQTVKQGQTVGYVGTTGSSTGNHLHFEIRLNGDRRDPLDYFKGSTLYASAGGKKVKLDL